MAVAFAPADHTRHIVTKGNLGFVANNLDLYTLIKKGNKFIKIYNVAPGQLVIWKDVKNFTGAAPKTVAPANIVVGDLQTLRIGVGYSTEGNGISDAIRQLTPTELKGCKIDLLDAVAPQCAVPQIKAVYPQCVSCDTISARVRVYDNQSISFSDQPLKAYQEFVASFTPDCASCSDCERTTTCDEVVCGLVDALNNDTNIRVPDGTAEGYPYPGYFNEGVERPFVAFKLHPTWKSYCIAPTVGTDCVKCNKIDDLTTFTIDDVDYNFGLTDPADNTKTLLDQLELAVIKINAQFETSLGRHSGRAFLSRGEGNCCPIQLFVSTCDVTFAIAGLTECEDAITQFPDFVTNVGYCRQCGSTTETLETSCGIGIFAAPDREPCDCFGINQPRQFNSRFIEFDIISASGNDNAPKYSKAAELLAPQNASGFGSQVQWAEYSQADAIGFEGFQYEVGNKTAGWLNLPEKRSRIRRAVTASCDTSYCNYKIQTRGTTEYGPAHNPINMLIVGNIWVPENDSTTKTAVEAFYQKVVDLLPGTCEVVTALTCAGATLS